MTHSDCPVCTATCPKLKEEQDRLDRIEAKLDQLLSGLERFLPKE